MSAQINVIKKGENKNVFFYQDSDADGNFVSFMSPLSYVKKDDRNNYIKIVDKVRGGDKQIILFVGKPYAFLDETGTPIAGLPIIPTIEELERILGTYFFFDDLGGGAPTVDTNFALNDLTLDANRNHDFNGFGMLLNAPAFSGGNVQPAFFLDPLGSLIGSPILGGKIGDLEGQNATILLIGEGGAGNQYQASLTASDGLGNEHRAKINENGFFVLVEDGGQAQRLEITKDKFEALIEDGADENRLTINKSEFIIKNALGAFITDLPTADERGKVLTLENATSKRAIYKFSTPKQVAESFNINTATKRNENLQQGVFYCVRRTIPAGIYNNFEFYIHNITGIGAGESATLRAGFYLASNEALISQTSLLVENAIIGAQRYTIPIGSNLIFEEATDIYFCFGANDFVGNFNIQCPINEFSGAVRTDQIFKFNFVSGILPFNLSGVTKIAESNIFYTQLKGL